MKLFVLVCILAVVSLSEGQSRRKSLLQLLTGNSRFARRRFTPRNACKANYKTGFDWDQNYLCEDTLTKMCKIGVTAFDTKDKYLQTCDYKVIEEDIEKALNHPYHKEIRKEMETFGNYYDMQHLFPKPNDCTVCPNNVVQIKRVNLTIAGESHICHVMHPKKQYIAYNTCSGTVPEIGTPAMRRVMISNSYMCVPDVSVSVKIWIYCPFLPKQCLQTELTIPLTCSAVQFVCAQPFEI